MLFHTNKYGHGICCELPQEQTLSQYRRSTEVWSNTNITRQLYEHNKISKCTEFSESSTKVLWSAVIFKVKIFIRFCIVNGQYEQALPICHTEHYKNYDFQIDGTLWYFGVWVWQLVHVLILVCSFQWCVLFLCLVKLYRSCPIPDKGLLWHIKVAMMPMIGCNNHA